MLMQRKVGLKRNTAAATDVTVKGPADASSSSCMAFLYEYWYSIYLPKDNIKVKSI